MSVRVRLQTCNGQRGEGASAVFGVYDEATGTTRLGTARCGTRASTGSIDLTID